MNGNPVRPKWRVLDLILIVVIALLVVEARAHLSSLGHEFAEVAIVLVWVVLMYLWLQANAAAISQEQWRKTGKTVRIAPGRVTVYRSSSLPASQKAEPTQPLSSAPGHHQASTAQQDNALDTPDPASAASETVVPTISPAAKETAPRGLSERSI